jgi:hypothetical protein
MKTRQAIEPEDENRAVGAKELLELLWTPDSRPSIQWLWTHTGKTIPAVRVGRIYVYSPSKVRSALGLM